MTPANLKAIRLRLGLQPVEAAAICALDVKAYATHERAKTHNVFLSVHEPLISVEAAMGELIDAYLAIEPPPTVLLTFMETEDFAFYEPAWASRLLHANVHRMAMARVQEQLALDNISVPMVELIAEHYSGWLNRYEREDSPDARTAWALEKVASFKVIPVGG